MKPAPFRYHRAGSLQDTVSLLSQLGEEARILAGGQSLIPLMKLRLASPRHLVDVNFIPGLSYIRAENGSLQIGPVTRHAEMETSAAVQQIPILHDCAAGIADVQVRNRGTLCGSLAHADPAGDPPAVAYALDAQFQVQGPNGTRVVGVDEVLAAEPAGQTALVSLQEMERQYVDRVLQSTGWNKAQAARVLEVDIKTLNKKIRDFSLEKRS